MNSPRKFALLFLIYIAITGNFRLLLAQNLPTLFTKVQRYSEFLNTPIAMAVAYDGNNRKFIVEQTGAIRIIESDILLSTNLINLKQELDDIEADNMEKGLQSLTFHPQFSSNGKFYVFYSGPTTTSGMDHKSVIAEYILTFIDNQWTISKGRKLLEVDAPTSHQTGGALAFGKDGMLFIGIGDGSNSVSEVKQSLAQDLNSFLGKILRIDVNAAMPYAIPRDNPFLTQPNIKPEIWAYGFRNPHRFDIDSKTNLFFCTDNGLQCCEEINLIEKGKNYGWPIVEGNGTSADTGKVTKAYYAPILVLNHSSDSFIIGGYFYHGNKFPKLHGKYIYSNNNGKLFYLEKKKKFGWLHGEIKNEGEAFNTKKYFITGFGKDEEGELYLLTSEGKGPRHGGVIFKFLNFE